MSNNKYSVDKSLILTEEKEEALRKPIDDFVGKVQDEINELRLDGTDKVRKYSNQIAILKSDKTRTKEEKKPLTEQAQKGLEKA